MAELTQDQIARLRLVITEMQGEIVDAKKDILKIKEVKDELLTAKY